MKNSVQAFKQLVGGQFFAVEFKKKTDGETRRMIARLGVRKFQQGRGRPEKPGLVCVWDVVASQYRSFYINSLRRLKFSGVEIVF